MPELWHFRPLQELVSPKQGLLQMPYAPRKGRIWLLFRYDFDRLCHRDFVRHHPNLYSRCARFYRDVDGSHHRHYRFYHINLIPLPPTTQLGNHGLLLFRSKGIA